MARETKAEREARIAREDAEQAAMCEKNYPTALMDILNRVNQLDRYFAFDIKDKKFLVTSRIYRPACAASCCSAQLYPEQPYRTQGR